MTHRRFGPVGLHVPAAAPAVDRNGLEVLDRPECLRLLASRNIGRLGVWGPAGPIVVPVNYVLAGAEVVVGTALDSAIHPTLGDQVVAFEVDDVDPAYEWGWSVLVRGRGRHLEDPAEVARAERLPLRSWGPGQRRRFTAIPTTEVSGRRLGLLGVAQT
jgi:nitroimidazol reductase NimA-like FMN-containing flavoprotein (pyridoxamine 5'-phosphate oxidase superfamily)